MQNPDDHSASGWGNFVLMLLCAIIALGAALAAARGPVNSVRITLPSPLDLGDQPVEHCCAEVWLEGSWVGVDSHVVDLPLAKAAMQRLTEQGRTLGYGMHAQGQTEWDGRTPSFGQFNTQDAGSLPIKDWGVYDDPYQFYSSTPYLRNKLGWASRVKWMLGANLVNRRVNALRRSVLPGNLAATGSTKVADSSS